MPQAIEECLSNGKMPEFEYDSLSKNIAFINHSKTNVNDLEYFSGFILIKTAFLTAYYGAKVENRVSWYKAVPSFYPNSKVWQKVMNINVVGGGDLKLFGVREACRFLRFWKPDMVSDDNGEIKNQIEVNTQEKPVELTSIRNSNFQLAFYQGDGFG